MSTQWSEQVSQARGIDLDPSRRPGVPRERDPKPWPNTRYPPVGQARPPSVPMHGRPHKTLPPVYGTAVPLRGLSGLVRKAAYSYPDHWMRHWTMLLFADRVDSWTFHARKLARYLGPLAAAAMVGFRALRSARRRPARTGPRLARLGLR